MSAVGRLWRRAPAWRLSLVSALVLTGLAAMFPPAMPALRWPSSPTGAGADQARFHPVADPAPAAQGITHLTPLGTARSGLIREAGRQVPLPAGAWQQIEVGSEPGAMQRTILVRVADHRLTGLFQIASSGALGGLASPVGVPSVCADPSRLDGAITPAQPGQSPLAHECWEVVAQDMHAVMAEPQGSMLRDALALLGKMTVAVPTRMLAVTFFRSTDSAWQETSLMVPDSGQTLTALRAWAGRYQAVLHKGFDGTAGALDLTKAALQDAG